MANTNLRQNGPLSSAFSRAACNCSNGLTAAAPGLSRTTTTANSAIPAALWPPALQGLDRQQRVIYLGTFSKVLFPGLRLAYLIVPPDLVEAFTTARYFAGGRPPLLSQLVLTAFMEEGHFGRHIRRMRQLYAHRQDILVEAAQRQLAGLLSVPPAAAGMHLLGWLPPGVGDRTAAQKAAAQGVYAAPPCRLSALTTGSPMP